MLPLLILAVAPGQPRASDSAPLRLDDIFASPSIFGTPPSAPRWSPDSRHFAFSWSDTGTAQRELWVVDRERGVPRPLLPQGEALASVREFLWLSDGGQIVTLRGDSLWSVRPGDNVHRLLGTLGQGASDLSLAPDGNRLAYLRDGDLWLFDLEDGTNAALTDVAIAPLSTLAAGRYRRPEREIGPGIWGGPRYAWSPDGRTIAVHYVDRQAMRKVPFPNYLAEETAPNEIRRGYPGDPNEYRTVGLLNVASGDLKLLELDDPTGNQVVGFAWSPRGVLLIDIASDTAEDRWLFTVDSSGGALRELWHSHRATRIYTAFSSAWHPDGQRVLFVSDLGDRYGLYALDPARRGEAPVLLTDPAADVLGQPTVAGDPGRIFFGSNAHRVSERHVYAIDTSGSDPNTPPPRRLTDLSGHNAGYPSPDGLHLAFMHSNDAAPPELYLARVDGDGARRVTTSPLAAFQQREWARGRYVSFPSSIDDYTLHARILEPPHRDSRRRYPVLFGPMYSNTARNRWAGIYSRVQQLLVQQGYIVVQVDVRGSTGYGRAFREEFLLDFAGDDIEDIASAVDYVSGLPYVDPGRMGIWGSSYGGTLSIYTLLKKPGLFHAAAAAAAAVDPHFFGTDDVAIVRRPETHPEVFLNSAERLAANLEDHLLIIHGMQDQVVPFKTTAALADTLMRHGKDFEFAFAAGATHAWSREAPYARYLFGRMLAHFDRYLSPGVPME